MEIKNSYILSFFFQGDDKYLVFKISQLNHNMNFSFALDIPQKHGFNHYNVNCLS